MENDLKTPFEIDEMLSMHRKLYLYLKNEFPGIYIGGSFALNALGLLDRHIHDIDFCLNISKMPYALEKVQELLDKIIEKDKGAEETPFSGFSSHYGSTTQNLVWGKSIRSDGMSGFHCHFSIRGHKIGIFFLKKPEETIPVYVTKDDLLIRVSNTEKIINAKKFYIESKKTDKNFDSGSGSITKHELDIEEYEKRLPDFTVKYMFWKML